MNIIVPIKLVPDLVEELKVDDSGVTFDQDWLRLKLNEFDEHALEQAILLKESDGGQVIVLALDSEGVEDALFSAAAKGADRIIRLTGASDPMVGNHTLARWFVPLIKELQPGLVLTGVQAHNDLDGSLGPLLAEYLGFPYVGYVADVNFIAGGVQIRKEFPGGLAAVMEVNLPAVLGIQAARKPPRYIAFSKIRQAMKTVTLEEQAIPGAFSTGELFIRRLYQPESGAQAEMLVGNTDEVAARLVKIFSDSGIL